MEPTKTCREMVEKGAMLTSRKSRGSNWRKEAVPFRGWLEIVRRKLLRISVLFLTKMTKARGTSRFRALELTGVPVSIPVVIREV